MRELDRSLGAHNQYNGLYGEVVTEDVYKLRDVPNVVSINDASYVHWHGHTGLNFVPDTVIDLGANVGIFSRYARELWPNATIVSVEPNEDNFSYLEEHNTGAIIYNRAIGVGNMYRSCGAANGAMESYLSASDAFTPESIQTLIKGGVLQNSDRQAILLTDLKEHISGKVVCKMDIEGNETVLFADPECFKMLCSFDYICAELHYYASDGGVVQSLREMMAEKFEIMRATHNIEINGVYFYETKIIV